MANIFLQLGDIQFKRRALQDFTGASTNKKVQKAIDIFFSSQKQEQLAYSNFLIDLIPLTTTKEAKQKLLIALVYYIVSNKQQEAIACLERVLALNEPVVLKVRFFSYVFKSTQNQVIKKWVIRNTVISIEKEEKISSYAGIIEHFDQLLETLTLSQDETFEIYSRLIAYLEKHPVYKKLCSFYVVRGLQNVTQKTAGTKEADSLMIKIIKSGAISDSALGLLNHTALQKNQHYPILQVLLTGDFEKLDLEKLKKLKQDGVVGEDVQRKMKIQAIPRLLSNVKVASYDQVAQRLNIKKSQVESYIIDAIKQGLIKAKLDEFQQTVIISRLNFRALRQEQRAKLQKDISDLIGQMSDNLTAIN